MLQETTAVKTARLKVELEHILKQPRLGYLADAKVREIAQHYAESDAPGVIAAYERT